MLRKSLSMVGTLLFILVLALTSLPAASLGAATLATVQGKVKVIDPAKRTIGIKKLDGTSVTITFGRLALITRNGTQCGFSRLALGDHIRATYDVGRQLASRVTATGPAVRTLRGHITRVNESGLISVATALGPKTLKVGLSTRHARNGRTTSLSNWARRDAVVLHYKAATPDVAMDVEGDGPVAEEAEGSISAITGNDVTIHPANGTPDVVVHVTVTTTIRIDDETKTLGDLSVGMSVGAEYDPATFNALNIEVDSDQADEQEASGTVSAVDVSAGTVTIDQGGTPLTLSVNVSTEIEVNGSDATLPDVKVGEPIDATYDQISMVAQSLEVGSGDNDSDDGTAEVEGTVSSVSDTGITILDSDGNPLALTVNGGTDIEVNDGSGTLADIHQGDAVAVEYDTVSLIAIQIEVDNGQ